RVMHRLIPGLLVLALAAPGLRADDKPAKAQGYDALKKEFDEAQAELRKASRAAKTPDEAAELRTKFSAKWAEKFLAFAEKNPKDASAYDALFQALRLGASKIGKGTIWAKALAALERDQIQNENLAGLVRQIAGMPDEATAASLKAVAQKSPSRKVQARAYQALADNRKGAAELIGRLKGNERLRGQVEKV